MVELVSNEDKRDNKNNFKTGKKLFLKNSLDYPIFS